MRSRMLWCLVAVAAITVVVWVTAGADNGHPVARPIPKIPCYNDPKWSTEGSDLLAFEKTHPGTRTLPSGRTVRQIAFAYESQPQNVTAGTASTFVFGPLHSDFNYPHNPFGFAPIWPPGFKGGLFPHFTPGLPRIISEHGQRYLESSILIKHATCTGLRLWIY
jgi:hypothetical protein